MFLCDALPGLYCCHLRCLLVCCHSDIKNTVVFRLNNCLKKKMLCLNAHSIPNRAAKLPNRVPSIPFEWIRANCLIANNDKLERTSSTHIPLILGSLFTDEIVWFGYCQDLSCWTFFLSVSLSRSAVI